MDRSVCQIRFVKLNRKRGMIRIRFSDFGHNQVYADAAGFDFLLGSITKRAQAAKQKQTKRA